MAAMTRLATLYRTHEGRDTVAVIYRDNTAKGKKFQLQLLANGITELDYWFLTEAEARAHAAELGYGDGDA